MKTHFLIGLCLLSLVAVAQQVTPTAGTDTTNKHVLFASDSVLTITLMANLRPLLKDRGTTPSKHAAEVTYVDGNKQAVSLPATVMVRGNFRRNPVNCSFPPLLLDFPKKKTKHTLFAHQNKLKLVTNCQTDEWVVREYLVYKLYNLLTDLSFRARIAHVTYADSAGKRINETHWGFLIEDDDDLAKRNGAKATNMKQTSMGYADSLQMATVAVFEYMIGNVDWSVPNLHNIRLLDNGRTGPLPVPYDFDYSGLVNTRYSLPAEHLGLESVRDRVYRGPEYPMPLFQRVFDKFNQVKPQFYALYQNNRQLDKGYVKSTIRYLDDFYAIINKPSEARKAFSAGEVSRSR